MLVKKINKKKSQITNQKSSHYLRQNVPILRNENERSCFLIELTEKNRLHFMFPYFRTLRDTKIRINI